MNNQMRSAEVIIGVYQEFGENPNSLSYCKRDERSIGH